MNELATNRLNLIFDTIMELDNLLCEQAYSTEHLDILHEEFEEDIECLVTTWYLTALKLKAQIGYNDDRLQQAEDMLTPDEEFFNHDKLWELRDAAIDECRDCTCGDFEEEF